MADYELIKPHDARLNNISQEVRDEEIRSQRVQNVIAAMTRIARGERDAEHPDLPSMVGLAAPQIGVFERIILLDLNAVGTKTNFDIDLKFIVNPVITEASEEEELGREGCYSTGDIAGAVFRAQHVTVRGLDEQGLHVTHTFEGFLARIAQHEIDHLNGIRFPDRIRTPQHLHKVDFDSAEFQRYREQWANWPNHYPFEEWLKMKKGEV